MKRQPLRIACSYLYSILVGLSLVALSAVVRIEPVVFAKSMGELEPGQSFGIPRFQICATSVATRQRAARPWRGGSSTGPAKSAILSRTT
jgi:hypothetical protein